MYIWDMLEKDAKQAPVVGVIFMWAYFMAQMASKWFVYFPANWTLSYYEEDLSPDSLLNIYVSLIF